MTTTNSGKETRATALTPATSTKDLMTLTWWVTTDPEMVLWTVSV